MYAKLSHFASEAQQILYQAQSELGTKASVAHMANYQAVFCRDAVVVGLLGLDEGDPVLIDGLAKSLTTLRNHQGPHGQIPSNVRTEHGSTSVSYGKLSPKLDSVSWYILGCARLVATGHSSPGLWLPSVRAAADLLDALEYNQRHLLYIPRGGNWADEFLTEGYTLFDQALRCWALREAAEAFGHPAWAAKSDKIAALILSHYPLESGLFASSILPGTVDARTDLAAHCMLAMAFPNGTLAVGEALRVLATQTLLRGQLPAAYWPIIQPDDPRWPELEGFHLFGMKNRPHHYHNGGIWWVWLGWLGQALHKHGLPTDELLTLCEQALKALPKFDFEEYLSSSEGLPGGTPKLCFTAAGIRMLHHLSQVQS